MPTYEVRLAGIVTVIADDEDAAQEEAVRYTHLQDVEVESVELIADDETAATDEQAESEEP